MSRFCFCNCPAGFSAAPERHAPDCPGRFGAGKSPTPVPATLPASKPVDSCVDFGIDGRSVRVSQEAYSIFLAREAASRQKINALQQRLTAADDRVDVLGGRVSMLVRELQELINDDDGILVAAELSTGFVWHALQKHGKAIQAALKPAEVGGDSSTCTWQHVDDRGIWDTGCGTSWAFTDEGPKENGMKFCHACGKTLMVEDAGDDD